MTTNTRDIGFISERTAVLWLKAIAYTVAILLMVLSVLGNFYWFTHRTATLNPARIVDDVWQLPSMFAIALVWQFITSGVQFGSLVLAMRWNKLWLVLWLVALCASAIPNIGSYADYLYPLFGVSAYGLIVAGDILPEVISVVRSR